MIAQQQDDRALFDMADELLTQREVRWMCPYCDHELPNERAAHCGEVGHAIPMTEDYGETF